MKKVKKSIYHNPKKYAKKCDVSLGIAKLICNKFKKLEKDRNAIICPCCKKRYVLSVHMEEVECTNCESIFHVDEIKNVELLTYGADFDAVLYFSAYKDKNEGRMNACGSTEDKNWERFVKHCI